MIRLGDRRIARMYLTGHFISPRFEPGHFRLRGSQRALFLSSRDLLAGSSGLIER